MDYAQLQIYSPRLYTNFKNNAENEEDCFDRHIISTITQNTTEKFTYYPLSLKKIKQIQENEEISHQVNIPVGRQKDEIVVISVTLIATFIGCLVLIYS